MVFNIPDTPHAEAGDQTRLSNIKDPDFTTENSIPSPSKDGNDLLKQIRGMRAPPNPNSPRSRLPLAERHNAPAKGEFTPLLKSATKNNLRRSTASARHSFNGHLGTPAGLKASYQSHNSPQLPLNSSVMIEDHTASSDGNDDAQQSFVPFPVSSSSALSTPLVLTARPGDGPLDKAGNLATLREQEARLEQLDKENFSLKLKINFLNELLKERGSEFNETAIKENADLKVERVTLQRDLKRSRKLLAQAQRDLQGYRQQLNDYMEKLKRRHANDDTEAHGTEQLRMTIAEHESTIKDLQEKLDTAQNLQDQVDKLQDECGDLEAEIRQKEQELDEKDEELQKLKESGSSSDALAEELEERVRLLEEKEEELEGLQEALKAAEAQAQQKLDEKDKLLEEKDDELRELEDRLNAADGDQSLIRSKRRELEDSQKLLDEKDEEIKELKQRLEASDDDQSVLRSRDRQIDDQKREIETLKAKVSNVDQLEQQLEDIKSKLRTAENVAASMTAEKTRATEEKDLEIETLQRRLDSANSGDQQIEELQDRIADLEADIRTKEQMVEEKEETIDNLNEDLRQAKQQTEEELIECEDRIQELEMEQQRHLNELQSLRSVTDNRSRDENEALGNAQSRIKDLDAQLTFSKEQEQQLRGEINKFQDQIDRLELTIREKDKKHNDESDRKTTELRSIVWEKDKAYEHATNLQRTVNQLQESQGSSSERERQLQENLQSEQVRHRYVEDDLRKQIDQISDQSQKRYRALQDAEQQVQDVKRKLSTAERQNSAGTAEEDSLREKIQALEDEIEVLQCSLEEDAEKAKRDVVSAKDLANSLQRQVKSLQQDLIQSKRQTDNIKMELEKEQEKAHELEQTKFDTAHRGEQVTADSNLRLQQKLADLQHQLSRVQTEKSTLQDDLAASNADVGGLRLTVSELESNRETNQKQARELRQQIQSLQREHERKIQSNIISYEHDIHNLEQELADSQSKQASLDAEHQAAQQKLIRLESKIKSMEDSALAQKTSNDTNVAERKDLHEMLKDAKLEAEDLAIQIQERDSRIATTAAKESDLRDQLKRVREERATQTSRADSLSRELESLKQAHDDLFEEMSSLRALQKQVRFPRNSISVSGPAMENEDVAAIRKRHCAELRGLVRQIEYLAARCRREERFRADLTYVKQYFTKQVEMHARYTQADLRLVRAMGIPVEDVAEEQQAEANLAVGRVETTSGSRPSLKCVGLMVLASCRMKRSAMQWGKVKKSHDALMKKLAEVKGKRRDVDLGGVVDNDIQILGKGKGSLRLKRSNYPKQMAF